MTTLPAEMLDRPAGAGARVVALSLLAEARAAAAAAPLAGEALHDLRVAVRRVRSTLRAWREVLGDAVRDKDIRRLRRVARATGAARDAEVLLQWLARAEARMAPDHRAAAAWLRGRIAARTGADDLARAAARLVREAGRLERRLQRRTAGPRVPPFGLALAARIRDHAAAVEVLLAEVETADDLPVAHRARIAGKRLRYLVEPLRDTPGARSHGAVKALKAIQDLLGDLQDAAAALGAVREARRVLERDPSPRHARARGRAREPAGLHPGLAALEQAASRRVARLLARLRGEVLRDHGARSLAPALSVAATLEARSRRPGPARTRRRAGLRGGPAGRARAARPGRR